MYLQIFQHAEGLTYETYSFLDFVNFLRDLFHTISLTNEIVDV
jgi:hypothetical protein